MMSNDQHGEYSEVGDLGMGRPHVVILGAGASRAALPEGDKHGRPLPLMQDLVSTCGLNRILGSCRLESDGKDFESIYTQLHDIGNPKLLMEVEEKVWRFFASLELPDSPTIYDMLVISLRKKDLIATFNWDPLLWQALYRNHHWIDTPAAVFLHGNVAIGFCSGCRKKGAREAACPECHESFKPVPILYPVGRKNYQEHEFIASEWTALRDYLESAYILTVFGYGAPSSDLEAVELMRTAYKKSGPRELEEVEIIDVKGEEELRKTWDPFIVSHHYGVCGSFSESWIANHPRRTCDTMWQRLMECRFLDSHHYPLTDNWDEIYSWYKPLIDAEQGAK